MTRFTPDDVAIVAAVNDRETLAQCLSRSPDVAAQRVPLIVVEGAPRMTVAYNRGLAQTRASLVLFAHQDVYLPTGWLDRMLAALDALSEAHPDWMVAAPYGVMADGTHAGCVWDVAMGRQLGAPGFVPQPIRSADELLLIVRRDAGFAFDECLPDWHMYGTDLIQSALAAGRSAWAVDLPVVHNNRPNPSLKGGFTEAYRYVRRKWRRNLPIHTTCSIITYNPLPMLRLHYGRRGIPPRLPGLQADSVDVAVRAGYETAPAD